MKGRFRKVKAGIFMWGFVAVLFLSGLLLYSFADVITPSADADAAIAAGKGQLFSRSGSGGLDAYQTFQNAYANYWDGATDIQKIRVRTYLAVTRLFDVLFRNDGGQVDSLTELLAQYGITREGDNFEDMVFNPPP